MGFTPSTKLNKKKQRASLHFDEPNTLFFKAEQPICLAGKTIDKKFTGLTASVVGYLKKNKQLKTLVTSEV